MKGRSSPKSTTSKTPQRNAYGRVPVYPSHATSTTTASIRSNEANTSPVYVKPFDHFKPQGGGAEGDIFRRFKIQRCEEINFFKHWNSHNISTGIFSRDEYGTLVFRVSSSDLSDLTTLGIGRADLGRGTGPAWTHVYDAHGISWLTQFGDQFPGPLNEDERVIACNLSRVLQA